MSLIILRVCAGWSEPLLVANTTLLESSCCGSYYVVGTQKNSLIETILLSIHARVGVTKIVINNNLITFSKLIVCNCNSDISLITVIECN